MNIKKFAKSIARRQLVPITEYLNIENRIVNVVNEPAIYLFWYRNDDRSLQTLSRTLVVKGARGNDI